MQLQSKMVYVHVSKQAWVESRSCKAHDLDTTETNWRGDVSKGLFEGAGGDFTAGKHQMVNMFLVQDLLHTHLLI